MPTDNKIVQIDTMPERLGRRAKLEQGLHGDVKTTLNALLPLLTAKTDDSFLKAQLEVYAQVKAHLQTYVEDRGKANAIHPEYVASVIDKAANDNAIFALDTGMCCVWGARYIQATGKRQLLASWGPWLYGQCHAAGHRCRPELPRQAGNSALRRWRAIYAPRRSGND